jgi:hypothetical protein
MKARAVALLVVGALAGCGSSSAGDSGIGTVAHDDTIIQSYDRVFQFEQPTRCSPYVYDRIVVSGSYVAEYDGRMRDGGPHITATYTLLPEDPFPLRLDLSLGFAKPFLSVAANENEAQFRDSSQNVVLDVRGYLGASPVASTGTSAGALPSPAEANDALEMARCELPRQTQLGFVPGFFVNRRDGVADATDGVSSHSADAPPVIPSWNSRATFLEAYYRAVACVVATGDAARSLAWECGLLRPSGTMTNGHAGGWEGYAGSVSAK